MNHNNNNNNNGFDIVRCHARNAPSIDIHCPQLSRLGIINTHRWYSTERNS